MSLKITENSIEQAHMQLITALNRHRAINIKTRSVKDGHISWKNKAGHIAFLTLDVDITHFGSEKIANYQLVITFQQNHEIFIINEETLKEKDVEISICAS